MWEPDISLPLTKAELVNEGRAENKILWGGKLRACAASCPDLGQQTHRFHPCSPLSLHFKALEFPGEAVSETQDILRH